jgi:hypothetical protein
LLGGISKLKIDAAMPVVRVMCNQIWGILIPLKLNWNNLDMTLQFRHFILQVMPYFLQGFQIAFYHAYVN